MPVWNPSSPRILGLEWRVDDLSSEELGRTGDVLGILHDATASGPVTAVAVHLDSVSATGPMVVDVYDVTSGMPAGFTSEAKAIARPSRDVEHNSNVRSIPNANFMVNTSPTDYLNPTLSYQFLGTPLQRTTYLTYRTLVDVGGWGGGTWANSWKFTPGHLTPLAGRRIRHVMPVMIVKSLSPTGVVSRFEAGISQVGNLRSMQHAGDVAPFQHYVQLNPLWRYNPYTRLPWTAADIQSFTSATPGSGFTVWATGRPLAYASAPALFELYIEIAHTAEVREATGGTLITAGAPGWRTVPLAKPIGGGTFSKVAGRQYLYVIRGMNDNTGDVVSLFGPAPTRTPAATIRILGWDEPLSPALRHRGSVRLTLDGRAGNIVYPGGSPPPERQDSAGVVLLSSGAPTVDSQLYALRYARALGAVGAGPQQEFRTTSTGPYGTVKAMLGWASGSQPTGTLTVRIATRTAPGTTLGSKVIDAGADPLPRELTRGTPQLVRIVFDAPITLTSGTQYFVEFVGDPADSWRVYGLNDVSGGGYSTVGYGGGVDNEFFQAAANVERDLMVTIGRSPPAPTMLSPTIVLQN
jgi:hypothetical protein